MTTAADIALINDGPIIQDFRVRNQFTRVKTVFNDLTLAGGSASSFNSGGNLDIQVSSAGVSPVSTAEDDVIAVTTIPAKFFSAVGKAVSITACGNFAATANNKLIKLVVGATSPVVGVILSGGTTIASTGTVATNSGAWQLCAEIVKYGAAASNTQLAINTDVRTGATAPALTGSTALTQTESGAITVAVVGNASTASSDIVFKFLEVNAHN